MASHQSSACRILASCVLFASGLLKTWYAHGHVLVSRHWLACKVLLVAISQEDVQPALVPDPGADRTALAEDLRPENAAGGRPAPPHWPVDHGPAGCRLPDPKHVRRGRTSLAKNECLHCQQASKLSGQWPQAAGITFSTCTQLVVAASAAFRTNLPSSNLMCGRYVTAGGSAAAVWRSWYSQTAMTVGCSRKAMTPVAGRSLLRHSHGPR